MATSVGVDPSAAGPILKDGLYFGFWTIVLGVGLTAAAAIIYLLWEILQTLRGR